MRRMYAILLLAALCSVAGLVCAEEVLPGEISAYFSRQGFSDYTCAGYGELRSAGEAFALMQNGEGHTLLFGFERRNGSWHCWLNTDKAVPQGTEEMRLSVYGANRFIATADGYTAVYPVISVIRLNAAGDYWVEGANYGLLSGGTDWQLVHYWNHERGTSVDLTPESLTYYGQGDNAERAEVVYGTVQTDIRYVNLQSIPRTLQDAQEKLTAAPVIPTGEMTAQEIQFTGGKKYNVYTGPGKKYARGGNGKAQVSTNDWIQVFGEENGWILIQYAINKDRMRFGWIPEKALPKGAEVPPAAFDALPAEALEELRVTDDPLNSGTEILSLPAGSEVTWLSMMGDWAYIESAGKTPVRGFVPAQGLRAKEKP